MTTRIPYELLQKKMQTGSINLEEYPDRKWLFHRVSGESRLILTVEEQSEMLETRDWVNNPSLVGTPKPKKPRKYIHWAERLKFRDPNKPEAPSSLKIRNREYISHMNIDQLVEQVKQHPEWGLDFSDPETRPTRLDMIRQIHMAKPTSKYETHARQKQKKYLKRLKEQKKKENNS